MAFSMKPSGRTTENVGGSIKFTDPGPKGKGMGIPKGNADVKALGRVAAGRIDPHVKGKTVS